MILFHSLGLISEGAKVTPLGEDLAVPARRCFDLADTGIDIEAYVPIVGLLSSSKIR